MHKDNNQKDFKTCIKHYLLFCVSVFLIGVVAGVVNGAIKKKEAVETAAK